MSDCVNVVEKTAQWIEAIDETHYCNVCRHDALWQMEDGKFLERLTAYCPHCGRPITGVIPFEEQPPKEVE